MNIMQNKTLLKIHKDCLTARVMVGLFLCMCYMNLAWASGLEIKKLNFAALSGDKVQLQLEMSGAALAPKVFQTDNPARIALDFAGVKSGLKQKNFPVNKGAASDVYVIEAGGRTRVVINLVESVPYETQIIGNKVLLTLKESNSTADVAIPVATTEPLPTQAPVAVAQEQPDDSGKGSVVARLLPQQMIRDIDFKRGAGGEGLLVVKLANPNTIVDAKEKGGKVVLKFLNTKLPKALNKRFDVSDFATPVQKIDAMSRGTNTEIVITTADGNYDYSSFQEKGTLIVDFRPMTEAEKEEEIKKKFPYIGDKLSLNFQDIDVRSVLQILADFTELNIVASDTVTGNVTLRLNDVPWDQALELILKANGLSKRESGNVVLVAPTEEITKLEEEELAAQKVVEQLEPLRTEYIQINYAKAEDIRAMLLGGTSASASAVANTGTASATVAGVATSRLLSDRGIATVDVRTNRLIVKDTADRMEDIRELIELLDVPIRQVMIESRIVIASKDFAQDIGVRFGVAKGATVGSNKFAALGGRGQNVLTSNALNGETPIVEIPDNNALVDLAAAGIGANPPFALGLTLARAADYVLNLELSALENENKGEIIANPRVMTSDRVTAYIKQGIQIQLTTPGTGESPPTQELVDALLELNVTPQITPNGSVIMELKVKKDSPDLGTGGINKREVSTTVQVDNGETVVLGGVYEGESGRDIYKVPLFGDLPLIGFLFRKNFESENKRELLIFVTPKIIKQSLAMD